MAKGTITVRVDGLDILKEIKDEFFLAPKGLEAATNRALNHALNAVRAEGVRISREKYTAKARALRTAIKIRRVSVINVTGSVFFSGRVGVAAGEFQIRPRKLPKWKGVRPRDRKPETGIVAQFIKEGGFSVVKGPHDEKSFLLMHDGRLSVWCRRSKTEGLRKLFGPSPIQALQPEEARERLMNHGQQDFRTQLANQVKRLFSK